MQNVLERFSKGGPDWVEANGARVVNRFDDVAAEYAALRSSSAILDLSFRGRLCLTGADRKRFLHGQVTNEVNKLEPGEGCYAAVTTAKGKMVADVNIYCLADELLLDFEPGLTPALTARLEKYIIADDVQIVDVSRDYGLLSVQGPKADAALMDAGLNARLPVSNHGWTRMDTDHSLPITHYVTRNNRGARGFDLFVQTRDLERVADKLHAAVERTGGGPCGWQALETVRIEAGLPRFKQDMDESNLAPECGIEERAISYAKGCYIGQEVIARIRTYGQVTKALRGLCLDDGLTEFPSKGPDAASGLYLDEKEVGHVTSAVRSPVLGANIALGYVRREHNAIGTILSLRVGEAKTSARIVELPFVA